MELFLGNAAACLLFGVVVAVPLRNARRPRTDQDYADTQADQAVGYRQALADRALVRFLLMTVVAESCTSSPPSACPRTSPTWV